MNIRRSIATVGATGALAAGSLFVASPAQAAPPNFVGTAGLVNVVIVDLVDIDDVTVQVPVAAAANICNVSVAALLAAIDAGGTATCTADADSDASNRN
jgi:hypothetical protein